MDLSKPININLPFNLDDIKVAKVPFAIFLATLIVALYLTYASLELYSNLEIHSSGKSQYQALMQEKLLMARKKNNLVSKDADLIASFSKVPKSKTEFVAQITSLLSKNKIKINKISSNEGANNSQAKDLVELEADGSFIGIRQFLDQIMPSVASSDVVALKISKSKDSGVLHLVLKVKFVQPPQLDLKADKVAFVVNHQIYQFDTFDNWKYKTVGFVQNPPNDGQAKLDGQVRNEDQKRSDPFQLPPTLAPTLKENTVNQADSTSAAVDKRSNAMYLSGIIHGEGKSVCIVALPSGQTKVFSEGEKVNDRYTVYAITDDLVRFSLNQPSKKKNKKHKSDNEINVFQAELQNIKEYKVGEEIPL